MALSIVLLLLGIAILFAVFLSAQFLGSRLALL